MPKEEEHQRRTPPPDAAEGSLIQPIQDDDYNNRGCLLDSCAKNSQDKSVCGNIWESEHPGAKQHPFITPPKNHTLSNAKLALSITCLLEHSVML